MIRRYRDLTVVTRYEVRWAVAKAPSITEAFSDVLSAHERVKALMERKNVVYLSLVHITESTWLSDETAR
jgi:hypothetical protein